MQDPETAEQMLTQGKADFVSLSRAWIAEPEWANKVADGNSSCIRRCINCNHCIGDRISTVRTVRCTLNAVAGREWKYGEGIGKAEEPKKVVVIGAGPGGLEAAYRYAMRGSGFVKDIFVKRLVVWEIQHYGCLPTYCFSTPGSVNTHLSLCVELYS